MNLSSKGFRVLIWILFLTTAAILLYLAVVLPRSVYSTYQDPSGRYTVLVTYRTYLSSLGMMPGSSADKPGFVEIIDEYGTSYGELPLPMLQSADLQWTEYGAEIKLLGEWNFKERTCYYWDETGNHKIYVLGDP